MTAPRKRLKVLLLGTAVAVVAVVGAALWWVVLRDDTPAEATLVDREVVAPADATAAEGVLDGTWTLVPGPDVWAGYRIEEHLLSGIDNVAVARTPDVGASLTIAGTVVSGVTVEVDMTTLASQDTQLPGVGNRDGAMRGEGLETDLHPTATFTLTEPIDLEDLPEAGTEVTADVVGVLTLHGVERTVTVPIAARWNGEVIDLTASVEVTLADFAIDLPAPQIVTVAGTGTVELQLTFAR